MSLTQPLHVPVTMYASTDANAPVYTNAAGSLNILLKACLVTGYGSKQSLGWELAYEDITTHKIVLKSKRAGGLNYYLRIDNSNADSPTIRAYKTMSDIDTGTDVLFTHPHMLIPHDGTIK